MTLLCCPVCQEELTQTSNNKSFECANKHMFDKAKQGYVNLLLSHQKKSKHPGDTIEMVNARTAFLNQGYYQAILNSFINIALQNQPYDTSQPSNLSYLDIACGEGYYTTGMHSALCERSSALTKKLNSYGIDISAPAIKAATKRNKEITWLVGSAYQLPFPARSLDLASCLFCRVDYIEASRVLKPGGLFIVATTGSKHLIELREKIYDTLKPDTTSKDLIEVADLTKVKEARLTTPATIKDQSMISNLLLMTPHYWRCSPSAQKQLSQQNQLSVTIDITFTVFKKNESLETAKCRNPNDSL
jgi:23S rRNA (guanine745-N1)-methyltransferase